MEIKKIMKEEKAHESLLSMSDEDLLRSIGILKKDKLTVGGLLLIGTDEAIEKHIPNYRWDFRKMKSSTEYTIKDGGKSAIPVALYELERYMKTENEITTVEVGFLHPEFPQYPRIALREGLLNSFLHRDYRIPGSIMLKLYPDRLVITNPGNFIGGITPDNILHHAPTARNSHLADMMDKLKLVNRSNLGVPRIYKSLLIEGKEPPQYREVGTTVELTLVGSQIFPAFRDFILKFQEKGHIIDVDHLIILNYLIRHREINTLIASKICQRGINHAKEILSDMENEKNLITSGGSIKKKYYQLSREVYEAIGKDSQYNRDKSLDRETVKMRILSILKERTLTNKDIRLMTSLERMQVFRMMKELETEGVRHKIKGRFSYYYLENNCNSDKN